MEGRGSSWRFPSRDQALTAPAILPQLWKEAGNPPNQSTGKVEVAPLLNCGGLGLYPFPAPPCLSFSLGADAFPPCPARPEPLLVLCKAFLAQLQMKPTPRTRGRRDPALSASSWLLSGLTDPTEPRLIPLPKTNLPKALPASPAQPEGAWPHSQPLAASAEPRGDPQLQHNKTRKKMW